MENSNESASKVTDSQLLERHLSGDEQAFGALVSRYKDELYNFLVRFTGNRALAEDVFQEAFLQLHLSGASFDLSKKLKPWLFTIAANKARDALRSKSRRPAVSLEAGPQSMQESESDYKELIPADIPEVSENLLNLELRETVLSTIQELPENHRMVLLLNYFQGLSYKEIAETLSIPLGTVKSRLYNGVREFAELWKQKAQRLGYEQK